MKEIKYNFIKKTQKKVCLNVSKKYMFWQAKRMKPRQNRQTFISQNFRLLEMLDFSNIDRLSTINTR